MTSVHVLRKDSFMAPLYNGMRWFSLKDAEGLWSFPTPRGSWVYSGFGNKPQLFLKFEMPNHVPDSFPKVSSYRAEKIGLWSGSARCCVCCQCDNEWSFCFRLWWNRLSHKFRYVIAAGMNDSFADMRRIENQD